MGAFARVRGVFVLTLSLVLAGGVFQRAAAQNVVPSQFIAKLHTEAIGRVPDRADLDLQTPFFAANGCNLATVQSLARAFYLSEVYQQLQYDNPAKLLTAFRGLLNREPDAPTFEALLSALGAGRPFAQVLDANFLTTPSSRRSCRASAGPPTTGSTDRCPRWRCP